MKYEIKDVKKAITFLRECMHINKGTPYDVTKSIIAVLVEKYGFTEFHMGIQKIIKKLVPIKDWEFVSSRIKGNETIWLVAIANYLDKLKTN